MPQWEAAAAPAGPASTADRERTERRAAGSPDEQRLSHSMSAEIAIAFLSHLQAKVFEIATRDREQNHEADRYGPEPKRALGPELQKYQSKIEAIVRLKNSK